MPPMCPFYQTLGKAIFGSLIFLATCSPSFSAAPLFARFSSDRTNIYAGEAFQITLAIHVTGETLAPKISIDALPNPDQLRLYPFQELPTETITLNGHPYEVRKFRAWARAPKAGSVSLSPRLDGNFIQTTRSFFFMQESRRPANIPVEPMTLTILPLPEAGRPADFSGLVGHFHFSVLPTPLNIALGDLISTTFTIEGDLLPDTYLKPAIKECPGLKVYDLKTAASESTPNRHVYSQTLVPGTSTLTAIPACSLSYFDTRQMRYKTLTAGPFPLRFHSEHTPVQTVYSPTQPPVIPATNSMESPGHLEKQPVWEQLRQWVTHEKKAVITEKTDVQVFLAPSESSQKLFTLKPGTAVVIQTTNENWTGITTPDGIGWLPTSAITPFP